MKKNSFIMLLFLLFANFSAAHAVMRIGIIGLDTSHSPAFFKLINSESDKAEFQGFKVVAAYPYGSKAIKSSYDRIAGYIKEAEENKIKITESIAELLEMVDFVMLETNDGNLHLEQAEEVLKAGKVMFIDKPIGANLIQSIAIVLLSERYKVPIFSSSALRYVSKNLALRNGEFGKVLGADCYSPAVNEPSHSDFYWYGMHGVETLFTIMGSGCVSVSCASTEDFDMAVGVWNDNRIGTCRGIRKGKGGYGGTAFCEKSIQKAGDYEGYEKLLAAILEFFRTKEAPVSIKETMEIYTFMETANESKRRGGKMIKMEDVYLKAEKKAKKLIK